MRFSILLAAVLLAGCAGPAQALGDAVAARWTLADPRASPDPGATELTLMVYEVPCSSGSPIEGRTEAPKIEISATSVVITIRVRQLLGVQTCPLVGYPLTVRLAEPLGNRSLLDGGQVPPAPPAGP